MDDPGMHARFRADREYREARRHPAQYPDTQPLEEVDNEDVRAQIAVPHAVDQLTGYEVPGYRPPPAVPAGRVPGSLQEGTTGLQGSHGDAGPPQGTDAARKLRMQPHLQLQCGPMLRYDTVERGIYHAFALIVTADTGSDYSTTPYLTLRYSQPSSLEQQFQQGVSVSSNQPRNAHQGSAEQRYKIEAHKIWIYHSLTGANSFWRFKIEIPLGQHEMPVYYSVNGGREICFFVPGINQNMRWAGHSCNGFSAGVDTEKFNGPDPLWNDLLKKHAEKPLHVLVGGGDQIYCDAMAREPELGPWMDEKDQDKKIKTPLTSEIRFAIDRFLFNHYTKWFRNGAFGRAIACIPMANMTDDHDLIDGFGSYPDDLQLSPVFSHIGSRGIFFYQLFQLFVVDEYDGSAGSQVPHPNRSLIWGGPGPYIPFNGHSFLIYLGPEVRMLLLDCRTERMKTQVVSPYTYEQVFKAMRQLGPEVKHIVILLGVPILYPRMVWAEEFLASKLNPLIILGKSGVAGFGGLVNRFNKDAELLDDLNDHWTAKTHKAERNQCITRLRELAVEKRARITFLSGDVHLAAVGRIFDLRGYPPEGDPSYMLNIISSAIVNTPPPMAVIGLQGKLNRTHKTLHHENIDENMVELFKEDTDGKKLKNPCFMGRRNYCIAAVNQDGSLGFDMRIEIAEGVGETKGYAISAPVPGW